MSTKLQLISALAASLTLHGAAMPAVASLLADKVIREDEIVGTALKRSTRKVTPPAV